MLACLFGPPRRTLAAVGACAAMLLHGTAAANVLFSGSGTWASDATSSSLSAPDATWSFLFVLPDTISASPTTAISSFSYRLAGVALGLPAVSMVFYSAQDGGMFDINFGGSMPSLSLYGNAVLSGSALVSGNYAVYVGVGGGQPAGEGSLSLVPVLVPVPEPATWASFGLGLGVVAALLARGRRPRVLRASAA